MKRFSKTMLLGAALSTGCLGQVITSQYDNSRSGADLHETTLTPQNVNTDQFGRLFSLRVDGDVYAQPLYLAGLEIPGKGKHDVVFVATEHDSVYAFDAEGQPRTPLWHVNFTNAEHGETTVDGRDVQCPFINPEIGITSTPVIDPTTGTLYVLARTKTGNKTSGFHYFQRLHALDVTNGAERTGSPVEIHASIKAPASGSDLDFDPLIENPRSALLLAGGNVFLMWGSSCDVGKYHGWVMAYDARSLEQKAVLNTSPNDKESGIWASDTGPAADQSGNVFVATGNGKFDAPKGLDYGDTLLKLRLENGALIVGDYFTPSNEAELNKADNDLGSGGPLLLPDQPGTRPHLVLIGGKGGTLYAIDRDRMGKFQQSNDSPVDAVRLGGSLLAAPAYWNGDVYVFANNDVLKDFTWSDGHLHLNAQTPGGPFDPGATPTISANGDKDGIVWTISGRNWEIIPEKLAILHAFDANDVSKQLYNSDQMPDRDRAGISVRFAIPTVANGRVYVGTRSEVDVYGLLARQH
ncbi:MAG: pyrrolo-quinoline quinone [Acidobacteriaceae bacterium]|nr:pyrrolo-quinoline quinone [Acidobacteriaceae bacterium]